MAENFYNLDGTKIKRKGSIYFYRSDWGAKKVKHALYKGKKVAIATDAIRPWENGGICKDLLCAKDHDWFKVIKNGYEVPGISQRFDLWECPICKSKFLTH